MIRMILAVDRGNAIGWKNGDLPWKIPADMKRFKELTSNSTVVMGWSTYKSLNRPDGLPNRKNYVLTRRPYSELRGQFGNVNIISSLDYIKRLASVGCSLGAGCNEIGICYAAAVGAPEKCDAGVWIIGGATIYDQVIEAELVDEIYLTLVDDMSGADVILEHDFSAWKMFVMQQAELGVYWKVDSIETPDSTTPITFIKLSKFQ